MCRGWVGPQKENADGAAEAWPAGVGHRLGGGGHWLQSGQDRRTDEEAVTQRRNNTTGVDRTTVARRQNKFHLFRPHGAV